MFAVDRHKSGTVAIDVHFRFEHAVCNCETYFRCELRIQSASPLTQGTSMRHCFIVCTASLNVKVIAY
jgi:hypothetical protein